MSASQRRKGADEERAIVNHWRGLGVDPVACMRVPLSGATEFAKADVRLCGFALEAKLRGAGFKFLYDGLTEADILTVRADRKERLYVMPESVFEKLMRLSGHVPGAR